MYAEQFFSFQISVSSFHYSNPSLYYWIKKPMQYSTGTMFYHYAYQAIELFVSFLSTISIMVMDVEMKGYEDLKNLTKCNRRF